MRTLHQVNQTQQAQVQTQATRDCHLVIQTMEQEELKAVKVTRMKMATLDRKITLGTY